MDDIKNRAEQLQNKVVKSTLFTYNREKPNEKELRDFSREYLALRRDIRDLSSELDKMYYSYQQMYTAWMNKQDNEQQSSSVEWLNRHQLEINFL